MYDASSWKSDNNGNPTLYMHTNSYPGNTFKAICKYCWRTIIIYLGNSSLLKSFSLSLNQSRVQYGILDRIVVGVLRRHRIPTVAPENVPNELP
jgi:hypothetical protein